MSSRKRKSIAKKVLRQTKRECEHPRCMTRFESIKIRVWCWERGYKPKRNWAYAVVPGMSWDMTPPGYKVQISD